MSDRFPPPPPLSSYPQTLARQVDALGQVPASSYDQMSPKDDTLKRLMAAVERVDMRVAAGRLLSVNNTLVTALLPGARVGELVELRSTDSGERRQAEVIGLDGEKALLAPLGSTAGLSTRTEVVALRRSPDIVCGDHLLGMVLDAYGRMTPIEPGGRVRPPSPDAVARPLNCDPPDPMTRPRIAHPCVVGLRAVDGLITCGIGQRVGIYGNAGAGKSTLISSIVANCEADVVVVGLIGERGREVGDFIAKTLTGQRARQSVVVAATSDRPPVERVQATLAATTIAEHFRDQGKHVLLVLDSVTRVARALRDLGLSANEPPTRRGFPPSVFSILPRLFERAGCSAQGAITAFYTVLVEGEVDMDPVAEETRALLDGHIVLSQELGAKGHYPAIDILASRSRVMSAVASAEQIDNAAHIRELVARYREIELLVQVGEYKAGSDRIADEAIRKIGDIDHFLRQKPDQTSSLDETTRALRALSR
jgi:type III secretion protein N (ATPase)